MQMLKKITSTAKVLVSCSDNHFKVDFKFTSVQSELVLCTFVLSKLVVYICTVKPGFVYTCLEDNKVKAGFVYICIVITGFMYICTVKTGFVYICTVKTGFVYIFAVITGLVPS